MRKYAHMGSFSAAAHFNVIDHNAALIGLVTVHTNQSQHTDHRDFLILPCRVIWMHSIVLSPICCMLMCCHKGHDERAMVETVAIETQMNRLGIFAIVERLGVPCRPPVFNQPSRWITTRDAGKASVSVTFLNPISVRGRAHFMYHRDTHRAS